jgi:hypothetical protein
VQIDSSDRTAEVYTEQVPPSWRKGAKPGAVVGALGVFLKTVDSTTETPDASRKPVFVFVAPRLAWYTGDLLGELGMDFGLLEEVQNKTDAQRRVLETVPFYSLLAAVGRAEPGQLLRRAEADFPKTPKKWRWTMFDGEERYGVAPLFNEPKTQLGRLVALRGAARQIKEIRIADSDIIARFGIDHYYEVSLFTDDSTNYDEKLDVSQSCPVTFCVRELPEGMPYGDTPSFSETVTAAGFFFKTWSYRVPKMTDPALNPKSGEQWSPLLVGRELQWHPTPKPAKTTSSGIIIGGVGVLLMAVIWFVAWRFRRQEKHYLDREPPLPDFDKIAKMDRRNKKE